MRQELTHDTVERYIEASPEALYDVVADVTRTPKCPRKSSPASGSTAQRDPRWGARFRARNHAGRGPDWHNIPVVTVAERGVEFVFPRTEKAAATILWRYLFTPEGTGTRVTESYRVHQPRQADRMVHHRHCLRQHRSAYGPAPRDEHDTQKRAAITEKTSTPR